MKAITKTLNNCVNSRLNSNQILGIRSSTASLSIRTVFYIDANGEVSASNSASNTGLIVNGQTCQCSNILKAAFFYMVGSSSVSSMQVDLFLENIQGPCNSQVSIEQKYSVKWLESTVIFED